MKRLLALLLALLLLTGCSTNAEEEATITTISPTEAITEATTVQETESLTEEPTEAPAEEPTEATTEATTEAPTEPSTEEPTEAPTEAEFMVTAISKTMYVTQWANIRTGPGKTYEQLTALAPGTAVNCVGVASNGWYKIKYNGGEAYIARNLVSDTKPGDTSAETEPPTTELPATEHKHNYTSNVTAPTCTQKGYTTYTCSCGDSYKADETAATGHNMVETDCMYPTCDTAGQSTMTCSVCGCVETTEIPIHGTFAYGCVPDYENDGHRWDKTVVCANPDCPYFSEYFEKGEVVVPHNYEVVFDCPCGPIGYTDYECVDCGYTNREHYDPIYAEHNYVEVEGLEEGYRTCTQCGLTAYSDKWE